MQGITKCPCCNDNEHMGAPPHDIMMTQIFESCGAANYIARYYYCPILDEIYLDDELRAEHENIIKEVLKEKTDGQE